MAPVATAADNQKVVFETARKHAGRGVHLSTSQLNLSRF